MSDVARPATAAPVEASPAAPSRRDEIVAIARRTFAEQGYSSSSMRDIAESAGLLAGSLYSHFRSKSEILKLVLEPLLDRLESVQEAALEAQGTGRERLERTIRDVLAVIAEHYDEITILHYGWSDLYGLEDIKPVVERSNRILGLWHQVIVAGMADGSIRDDVHPELLVRVLTSSLHAAVDRQRYTARPFPPTLVGGDELAEEFVGLFMTGLGSSPTRARRIPQSR